MRKWRALIIATFLLLALLSMGIWALYRYPIALKTIVVDGTHYVKRGDISRAVTPYYHRNAVMVSGLGILSDGLVNRLPQIQSVETDFQWPHAVRVTVTEKRPWIGIKTPSESIVLAQDGTVLRRDPSGRFSEGGLIVIQNVPGLFVSPRGVHPYLLNNLRPIVSTLRRYFPIEPIHLTLNGLYLAPTHCSFDFLTITLQDGTPVQVGPDQDVEKKISGLWHFLSVVPKQSSENRRIEYIDLRVPGKVIVRYGA